MPRTHTGPRKSNLYINSMGTLRWSIKMPGDLDADLIVLKAARAAYLLRGDRLQ